MQDLRIQVAIAILHQDDRYLLQLRDNKPEIVYPAYWGLFGGHVEPGEHPDDAVGRELLEEIGYEAIELQKFGCYADDKVIRHIYQASLTVGLDQLQLNEGWDMGLATVTEIQAGEKFSPIANQIRPIGPTHQKALLDFIAQQTSAMGN